MGSKWAEVSLRSVAEINTDTYSPKEKWVFVNYLDTGNITEGQIASIQLITDMNSLPSRARRKVQAGDIVYSTVRPNQKHYGIIDDPVENMLVSTGFIVIHGIAGKCDSKFLYYFLTQNKIIEKLQTIAEHSTSAYPSIRPADIESLVISLPPLPEQRAIAHILGTLDDKIELNRKMNETLEAMAHTIFKSWFVDFDPVRAKADLPAGRQEAAPSARPGVWFVYAIECEGGSIYIGHTEDVQRRFDEHLSGKGAEWTKTHRPISIAYWEELPTQKAAIAREKKLKTGAGREWLKTEICKQALLPNSLPKEIADLFPDSFEDSELGKIPKGWLVGAIGENFNLTMGQSPPGETYNEFGEGVPFFQGRTDFGFRYPRNRVFCTAPKRLANAGDTLVSVRAPVGAVNIAQEKCCIGRGVAAIRHKSGSRSYTYYFIDSIADVFSNFEAEGTVFGCINKSDFQRIKYIVPSPQLVARFEKIVFPIDQNIESKILEAQTLAATRDALLPNLLSGEIRIKDANKFIEEIT